MKKLLTLVFSVAVLTFCGCAGKGANASANTAGEPTGDVSTYLQGAYIPVADAQAKLTAGGFEVLTTFKSIKDGKTILFTSPTLKQEAAKPGRAYIAVMRMFIDDKLKTVSITNPVYFGKAYMQKDYVHATFKKVKAKIEKAFPGLKNSADKMEFDDLGGFHFTIGMPYYEDQKTVGKGSDVLAKAKKYKKGKKVAFELKLSETSTLLGYDLGASTKRFVKKIGRANSGLLPWMISIENGKANILKGEYYIALNYPLLDMGGFMGIMSIPDSVIKDLSKPFKKR